MNMLINLRIYTPAVDYYCQIAKLESCHWGVMIYKASNILRQTYYLFQKKRFVLKFYAAMMSVLISATTSGPQRWPHLNSS